MSETADAEVGMFGRALRRVGALWRDMAASVSWGADETVEEQLRACLDARGGEVSARSRAARLAEDYIEADAERRRAFLVALACFDADEARVADAMAALADAPVPDRPAARARLRRALEPPRIRLLTQFTSIPNGMKFLVDLRADLLGLADRDPSLAALESDFRALLANFFDVGFLELRRIDWTSPAALLEKLVGYEAVHRIRTWRDLKNRLDSDRRCYAFFHPRMPDEPLIFVEVALTEGMAASVQALLDEKAPVLDPRGADTAVFYSINNCQRGLDGISFGNFLIKRVVGELSAEFRNIKAFVTLSPIPGFRRWLDREAPDGLLTEEEERALAAALPGEGPALPRLLARREALRGEAAKLAEPVLTRLCARFLLRESDPRRPARARDPVAHFHLANGARVERLNWRGDTSEKGWRESLGLMVNYLYDPARIEEYHEQYAGDGTRAAATALRRLARG
jgi:malonyl-CoA decarboxylase